MLRGATSFPIHVNNRSAYMGMSSSDQQETDAAQVQQSPQDDRAMQHMQRSQSLALPQSLHLEANGRSATNRSSYRRADLVTRSQRHVSKSSDDGNVSGMLRSQLQHQQQQKGDKSLPRRRITNQNIEPAKAKSTLKEGGFPLDSPRVGSGLIKVGLAPGSEDNGRTGC